MTTIQDQLTGIQNNTTRINSERNATTKGESKMDQDAFMQLLMTQLKYQDPLNPVGNTEFISQQAQFTQIAELQKMNQSNAFSQANSMIGKKVEFPDPENRENTITGIVSETIITSKGAKVVVNDKPYNLSDVVKGDYELKTTYPTIEDVVGDQGQATGGDTSAES